ncbi:hypothetical protein HYC85_029304, partial [Camellia sinensis]
RKRESSSNRVPTSKKVESEANSTVRKVWSQSQTRSSLSKTLTIPESGIVASSIEPGSNAEQVQNGRTHPKEANSLHQDPQYEKQELKTTLLLMSNGSSMHWVRPLYTCISYLLTPM